MGMGSQPLVTTVTAYGVPGCVGITGNQTTALTAGTLYYYPCYFDQAATISVAQIHVTTLGASGTAVLGIYSAGASYQPVARISSFGSVSTATTGSKTLTSLSVAVTRGLYLLAVLPLTANCTLSSHITGFVGGAQRQDGTTGQLLGMSVTGQTSLTTPPTAWTAIGNNSSNALQVPIFLKWS